MDSKALKQNIALAADFLGMRGPVEKRTVAEEVMARTSHDQWSQADIREAMIRYVMGEITAYFNGPLPVDIQDSIRIVIPPSFRDSIGMLPRFICISERGGVGAQHVMTYLASVEDWDKNYQLKAFVAERAAAARNVARDIRNILIDTGAESLSELGQSRGARKKSEAAWNPLPASRWIDHE